MSEQSYESIKRPAVFSSIPIPAHVFLEGFRDAAPIGLGYLAVSFSIGVAARNIGLTAFQGFLASLLNNASAGEYAGFTMIAIHASYFEIFLITLTANARYLLMSLAMCQRLPADTPLIHRLLIGYDITDEIFGIAIARPGPLNPSYIYGAIVLAAPCWATGTALGVIIGNILPARIVSALSVALFGMFIAIIIPPCKKDKAVGIFVFLSFAASYFSRHVSLLSNVSSGTLTIIITVVLAAAAAIIFPVPSKEEHT